jgi:hypothetical protein
MNRLNLSLKLSDACFRAHSGKSSKFCWCHGDQLIPKIRRCMQKRGYPSPWKAGGEVTCYRTAPLGFLSQSLLSAKTSVSGPHCHPFHHAQSCV